MSLDYDLVIIGSSLEGIYAATTATYLQARVALITQNYQSSLSNRELINSLTLTQIANFTQKIANPPFGIELADLSVSNNGLKTAKIWAEGVNDNVNLENSLANLAALGVDIIEGEAEFCRLPEQALIVGKRKLRSRAYLIASGTRSIPIQIEGSAQVNYLTVTEVLAKKSLVSLPDNLVIVGDSPRSLELTQSLARLGKNVVLVIEQEQILPQEDVEAARLIQMQLEAEGIKIITASPVTQIKSLENQQWLQAGKKAIATDTIIFTAKKEPNVASLNLPGVGVKYKPYGILVNSKLQTTNPRIYACGDVIGGYSLPNLGIYEANIALKNALFLPWQKIDYRYIPWAIFTEPNLARVGMTEAEARNYYGQDIYVVRQNFKQVIQAQILGKTTGFCKLIIHKSGEILGAHIIGYQAAEWINAIALAMKQKIKLNKNIFSGLLQIDFPHVSPSFAEIMQQTAVEFHRKKLQANSIVLNLLDIWFNWRRT
jgi:pyruvate/2-oxoglutarate dehydrogenase complex dihydrolipoamide dehydrogenase (E3) component